MKVYIEKITEYFNELFRLGSESIVGEAELIENFYNRGFGTAWKAGFSSNIIEKLYIEGNNFKVVRFPVIVELVELEDSFGSL